MADSDTPVEWVGSSKEDLSAFPRKVKETMGFAVRMAQKGGKHIDAKPLKGFGAPRVGQNPPGMVT